MDKLYKRLMAVLLSGLLLVGGMGTLGAVPVAAAPTGDDGTTNWDFIVPVTHQKTVPSGWTAIRTANELNNIRNSKDQYGYVTGQYILMNDIDLAGWGNWEPIGNLSLGFSGKFNGNGYVIKNMSTTGFFHAGLFGSCSDSSIIQDLGLTNSQVHGISNAGGIAGWCRTISNCYNIGDVSAVSAYPQPNGMANAGGIVGVGNIINNSYHNGSVFASSLSSTPNAGGIVGSRTTGAFSISTCYNIGTVSAYAENYGACAGGIAGGSGGLISTCYNFSRVEAIARQAIYCGGIVGYGDNNSTVNACFNKGDIKTTTTATTAININSGGVAGLLAGRISNCFNTGNQEVESRTQVAFTLFAGGIAGAANQIENCYNVGTLNANSSSFATSYGGICGTSISLSNCFFLSGTAGKATKDGESATLTNVRSLTDTQMRQQSNFTGFNFTTVWEMPAGGGYPVLRGLPGQGDAGQTYAVNYNANCPNPADVTNMPLPQIKNQGQALPLRNERPNRTGYEFKGWATTPTATVAQYQPGGSYTTDAAVTLYAVWLKVVNFDTDRWSFGNQNTTIPLAHYTKVLGVVAGNIRHLTGDKGTGGQCYGMAATTAAINYNLPAVTSFGRNRLIDVALTDRSSVLSLSAQDFIQITQISQFLPDLDKQEHDRRNNINALQNAVRDFADNQGLPVVICIYGQINGNNAGHTVYALRLAANSRDIIVNDSNFPNEERTLTLNNGAWSYQLAPNVTWSSTQPNGIISYRTPTPKIAEIFQMQIQAQAIAQAPMVSNSYLMLSTNTSNFTLSTAGKTSSGSNANTNVLIPSITKGETYLGGIMLNESGEVITNNVQNTGGNPLFFWVNTTDTVSFSNLIENSSLSLSGDERGIAVDVPQGSTAHLNVAQNKANITVSKGSAVTITHNTAGANNTMNTIVASGQSAGQIQSVQTGQTLAISGLQGTVQLESKSNGVTDTKTVTGVKEGETVYVTIQNNRMSTEVKETPPDLITIFNVPSGSLQYRASVTLAASEPVTWSSDSAKVKVNSATGEVQSVYSSIIKSSTAKITATSLDGQRTASVDIQIKPSLLQRIIIIFLFGWLWF